MAAKTSSTVVISTRVSAAAARAIEAAAREGGVSPSGWLRTVVADRLGMPVAVEGSARPRRKRRRTPPGEADLAQAVRALGGVGTILTTRPDTPPAVLTELRSVMATLVAAIHDPDPA